MGKRREAWFDRFPLRRIRTGKAGVLDSMLIPAFSMLIKQGTACAVEGDMKVAMAMSILKTISGTGQLAEMYSIDFNDDIAIIGHSGSAMQIFLQETDHEDRESLPRQDRRRIPDPVLSVYRSGYLPCYYAGR